MKFVGLIPTKDTNVAPELGPCLELWRFKERPVRIWL
jgi:hypothetical protein